MKPIYKCGYQTPTLIKLMIKLICFFTIPFLLTLIIENLVATNGLKTGNNFIMIIYPITLLVTLLVAYSYRASGIYLFYHNFMLYKEKLNLYDRIQLFFIKEDLNRLENYLNKRNYATINELKIIVQKVSYMRSSDIGIEIRFKLIFNDNNEFNFKIVEDTKEAYQQFLQPFINYHIYINDPHNLIDGLTQPLRLTEYFIQKDMD